VQCNIETLQRAAEGGYVARSGVGDWVLGFGKLGNWRTVKVDAGRKGLSATLDDN
jgi:hypothetical protein